MSAWAAGRRLLFPVAFLGPSASISQLPSEQTPKSLSETYRTLACPSFCRPGLHSPVNRFEVSLMVGFLCSACCFPSVVSIGYCDLKTQPPFFDFFGC